MKIILTLSISAVLFTGNLGAQTAVDSIETNNIKALVTNNGTLFSKLNFYSKFEVPKGSGKKTIFGAGPWMGGLDSSQNLHVAANMYHQKGFDFQCGPSSSADSTQASFYDKIYKITRDEVNYHLAHFNDVGYQPSAAIANWPANGRNQYGEPKILAAFDDKNSNQIYEPLKGEAPLFPGDEAYLAIFNDNRQHTESGGSILNFDIYQYVYAYKATDSTLANTLFVKYRIVNRSGKGYTNFYLGNWIDYDLGNYADDFVGTDSLRNMVYVYNGDNNDGGNGGYGLNPPAMGCQFLGKTLTHSMTFNNDFSVVGNPTQYDHYYNYLQSIWADGSHLSYGGSGYGGSTKANFYCPSHPDSSSGWNEKSAGNTPGDRRMIGSIGPLTFGANQEMCLHLAYIYARGKSGPVSSVVELMKRADDLESKFQSGKIDNACNAAIKMSVVNMDETANSMFELFPNPANSSINIRYSGAIETKAHMFDILGKSVGQYWLKPGAENQINLSSLASGIYLIQVGEQTKKLVKE